jgi:hypothetical protein
MGKRSARRQQEQDGQAYEEGQQTAPPGNAQPQAAAPGAAPEMSADVTARLGELGKLHEQGVLTDEEFAQAKGKLLGL